MKKTTFILLLICQFTYIYAGKIKGKLYFSWGYNKEWYTNNNIKINQPSLNNNYMFVQAKGVDKPGWETGIFDKELTIPQYNYRLGYNLNNNWAVELNFDHTKYQIPDQELRIKGVYEGRTIDSTFTRSRNNLSYQLNNGANFFLFNLVRKYNIYADKKENINVKLHLKGGLGFVVPHVENTIMGQNNKPHFQFGGFDTGVEAALNVTFYKRIYIEYSNKAVYALYRNLRIYEGKASQNLTCYEMIMSLGVRF